MTTTVLILGGTGKTGRRIATLLGNAGLDVRTAARSGADVAFSWSDSATHAAVLAGADRVYLVPPTLDLGFAGPVHDFLDRAQAAGVGHVTYLSARGVEQAPPQVAMRAVELDLAARDGLTYTILRPAFFMQNFTEGAYAEALTTGTLALPAGDGAEAFIDVLDIAAAAAASLQDPAAHAGAEYELTGPEALTHTQVAALLSRPDRPVTYVPLTVENWVAGATAAGLPADYAAFLAGLLAGIANGDGARPTDAVQRATGRPPTALRQVLARADR